MNRAPAPALEGRVEVATWRPARHHDGALVHYLAPHTGRTACDLPGDALVECDSAVACPGCRAERKRLAPRGGWPGPARRTVSARFTDAQLTALDAAVAAGYAAGRNAALARLIDEHCPTVDGGSR